MILALNHLLPLSGNSYNYLVVNWRVCELLSGESSKCRLKLYEDMLKIYQLKDIIDLDFRLKMR